MIRINLLPVRAAQKKERVRSQLSILVLCLIAVMVVCGAEYLRMESNLGDKKEEIQNVQNEINKLQKKIGEVSKYKKFQEDLKKKLNILQVLKDGRSGPVRMLDQLNKSLPDKLWLTELSIKNSTVKINGLASDEKLVASFMESLELSPYYSGVELNTLTQVAKKEVKLQQFVLTCRVSNPAKLD